MFGESIQNGKGMRRRAGIRVPNLPSSKSQFLPYSSHEVSKRALISLPANLFLHLVVSITMVAQISVVAKGSEVPPATATTKPHPKDSVSSRYIPTFISRWNIGLVLITLFVVVRQVMRFCRFCPLLSHEICKDMEVCRCPLNSTFS